MKYLQDTSFHTPSAAFAKFTPFDKAFLYKPYKQVPPPSSGPSPITAEGPDFSNPRLAWMFNLVEEGRLFLTVVANGDYDRVDPGATLFAKKGKDFPPTYSIHGTADTLVDSRLSQRAHDELLASGFDTRLTHVEGASHGFDAKAQRGDKTFTVVEKDLNS